MASDVPSRALPALNCIPTEILHLIFAHVPPVDLWHLRRTSKRFNAVLHPYLLSTLRAMADPLPLTLIKDTTPVPLSFVYNLVLAVMGYDEGRRLWGRVFPSRYTSTESPYSSWLPATLPHLPLPPPADQELSPSTMRRQRYTNGHPDLFIPHLRAASPSLANLRRVHFWSILLWYKESSVISGAHPAALAVGPARKSRLRWAYNQHRGNYESRPGDDRAVVDEFTRTYILRSHFDRSAPRWYKDHGALHMRSRGQQHSVASSPELDHWVHGVTLRERPPDYPVPLRMTRRSWRSDEYNEARKLIFASRAEFERHG
ncbi:F-box domain-containing protein [Colletotrichum zoysiae]|uniref:F-box domain-containing protein n=1 Tax=Colletotrichum zoysiae TaxID=1216348 RepID=A0AAD9HT46_9PEZI|nr:F-box domain-containing protein [Colletotrichum zoysiae]